MTFSHGDSTINIVMVIIIIIIIIIYPISFHRGPDTWMMPFCCQPDGRDNETKRNR